MSTTTTTTPHGVIVTETEDYISFRLPSWLTDDERARIKSALDEWWSANVLNWHIARLEGIEVAAGRGQDEPTHRPEPDVPGYCTCGTLRELCDVASRDKARR